jgi:tetratricopeptide (TPR) repeat protein
VTITALAARNARRLPGIATGWFWFLITLLPMIGLIQVGAQARADRYTYIPQIGLIVAATWGVLLLTRRIPGRAVVLSVLGIAILSGLALSTRQQIPYWRDSRALFGRAADVTPYNYLALYSLAVEYGSLGAMDRSVEYAEAALDLHPGHVPSRLHLGYCHGMLGRVAEAAREIGRVLHADPNNAEAHIALGEIYLDNDMAWMAVINFERAVDTSPGLALGHARLGVARERSRDLDGALEAFEAAVALDPRRFDAHLGAGRILESRSEDQRAAAHLEQAATIDRRDPRPQLLLTAIDLRRGDRAAAEARYEALRNVDPMAAMLIRQRLDATGDGDDG